MPEKLLHNKTEDPSETFPKTEIKADSSEIEEFFGREKEILGAYGMKGGVTIERGDSGWAFDAGSKKLIYDPNFFINKGYSLKEALFATAQILNGQYAEFLNNSELMMKEEQRNTGKPHIQLLRKTLLNVLGSRRAVSAMPFLEETKKELCKKQLSDDAALETEPLHIQFIKEILSEEMAGESAAVSKDVKDIIEQLRHFGKTSADILNLATTPSLKTEERLKLIREVIEPIYSELYRKDLENAGKGRELFDEIDEGLPSEEQDEYFPQDMESQESKEEPPHIFKIAPGIAGYYPDGVRNIFDQKTLRWRKEKKLVSYSAKPKAAPREYKGKIKGNIALPLPRGFSIDAQSLIHGGGEIKIFRDQFGAFYASSEKLQEFSFKFGEGAFFDRSRPDEFLEQLFSGKLSEQTEAELENIKNSKTADEQTERLVKFIRKKFKYDIKAQGALYKNAKSAEYYFKSIDAAKKLECYTANTFFISLCRKLGIPSRLVTGHHISSLDKDGDAKITRNTGHAWAEIWNGSKWILCDATPPAEGGDFKENQDSLNDSMPNPMPEKDSEEMKKDAQESLDKKRNEPSLDQKIIEQWAKEHGISAEDVLEYRKEYEEVAPLVRELREVFKKIVSRRLRERWKMSPQLETEGEALDEGTLAESYVESKAGGKPAAFREITRSKKEEIGYGSLDMTLINDLSGSMNEGMKLAMDRKSKLLFLESLADFQKEIKEAEYESGVSLGLEVKTETRAFGDFGDAELKPLSLDLSEKDRIAIWKELHKASGGTPDYLSLEAVEKSISDDYAKKLKEKRKRRVVVVLSDGESQDSGRVQRVLDNLRKKGVIVSAFGMTSSGQAVKETYKPDAEVIENIRQLPKAMQNIIIKYVSDL